jgi:protein subunit release factor B
MLLLLFPAALDGSTLCPVIQISITTKLVMISFSFLLTGMISPITTCILSSRSIILATAFTTAFRAPTVASFFSTSLLVQRIRKPQQSFFLTSSLDTENSPHIERNGDSITEETTTNNVKPTWTYVPYDPNQINNLHKRYFSTWIVPTTLDIPQDKLDVQFVRSSGAGGQNVNKVNTKVEVRLDVMNATWIPQEVRERLCQQQANRMNKDGILSLASQEYRTQGQNRKAALDKLQAMILEAWPRPKVRKQRTGISKASKERNKEFKKQRSEVKRNRKQVDW